MNHKKIAKIFLIVISTSVFQASAWPNISPPRFDPLPNSGDVIRAVPILGQIIKKDDCDQENRKLDDAYKELEKQYAVIAAQKSDLLKQQSSQQQTISHFRENQAAQERIYNENILLLTRAKLFVTQIQEINQRVNRLEFMDTSELRIFINSYSQIRLTLPKSTQKKLDVILANLNSDSPLQSQQFQNLKSLLNDPGIETELELFTQSILANNIQIETLLKSTEASIQQENQIADQITDLLKTYEETLQRHSDAMKSNRGMKC